MQIIMNFLDLPNDAIEYILSYLDYWNLSLSRCSCKTFCSANVSTHDDQQSSVKNIEWAAEKGYINVLKMAIKSGCFWNENICCVAAKNEHPEIIKWAIENGCPWHECIRTWAYRRDHNEILNLVER